MKILSKKYNIAFNKVLKQSYDYFEELGLKPIVTQHTLLGIHRDNSFLDRPNDCHNIMCLAKDITPEVQKKFQTDGFWTKINPGSLELTNQYFKFGKQGDSTTSVELLSCYPLRGDKIMMNFAMENIHIWDKKLYDEVGEIEFMGNKYRVPKDIEGWLETYYGKGWKKPDATFHWKTHSVNMTKRK